ncbi:MAG: glycosyl hydrolase family 18 protein [Parachlamydiaceae bacterium]
MQWLFLFLTIWTVLWSEQERVVAAYFENYAQYRPATGNRKSFSIEDIDTVILTDLYYAFATFGYANKALTGNFEVQPTEENDLMVLYPQMMSLKKAAKQPLRLFLTIGGWNFNDVQDPQGNGKLTYRLFSQMVADAKHRNEFIASAIDYAHRYGFDGIDIDWEYPGDLTRGGSAEDLPNFVQFLKECHAAFNQTEPKLLLSYAAPAHIPEGLPENYRKEPKSYFKWLALCAEHLDRLNVMAYDYHTPYSEWKITGANSPLNRDTEKQSPYFIAKTLDNYLSNGIPADKIILGLPAFGRSYGDVSDLTESSFGPGKPFRVPGDAGPSTQQAGYLSYYEIVDLIKSNQLFKGMDSITSTAVAWNISSKQWVSYDTPETTQLKAQLVKERGLKGVVLWAIDLDEYAGESPYPITRSIHQVLNSYK